ncbi:MAG: hypothetical protein ABH816_00360 [Candidatus Levyibacteriota bacterium]
MESFKFNKKGFSVVELIVVFGVTAIIFGLITFNLLRAQYSSSLNGQFLKFVADVREQQLKAMIGDTEGRSQSDDYGVRFEANRYILFHGSSYNANDPTNFIIYLDQNLEFSSTSLPGETIVFNKGSGEIAGFISGQNTLTLKNIQDNEQKTLTFNKYGVISGVN